MIVLNTVIFLLLVNALLFVAFWIKDSIDNNKTTEIYLLGDDSRWVALEKVYPDSSRAEIKTLLNETYSPARAFLYEPFTEFKERPYAGKYVNVDRNGFRVSKIRGHGHPIGNNPLPSFSSAVRLLLASECPTIKPSLPTYRSS